jgi:hypothetical protein
LLSKQIYQVNKRKKTYGVPNLKLNWAGIDGDHASSKFNTDGEIMNRLESFVSELQEQA